MALACTRILEQPLLVIPLVLGEKGSTEVVNVRVKGHDTSA